MDTPRDVPHQSPTACCLPSAHDSTWDIAGGDSGGGEKYLFIKRFISKNYKKKKVPSPQPPHVQSSSMAWLPFTEEKHHWAGIKSFAYGDGFINCCS